MQTIAPATNSPHGGGIKPRLLTVTDACTYTGFSRAYLYREMKEGGLKFIKINGSTRIEVSELDRWIDAKSGKAAA